MESYLQTFLTVVSQIGLKIIIYIYIYIEGQSGFRSGMGTIDNIFVLHSLINHFVNNNNKLFCAFADFSKAFDYVARDNLWHKFAEKC